MQNFDLSEIVCQNFHLMLLTCVELVQIFISHPRLFCQSMMLTYVEEDKSKHPFEAVAKVAS